MALPDFAIQDDTGAVTAIRDKTNYDDAEDELPGSASSGQMLGILNDAKRQLYAKTGSEQWFSDVAYGQALVALGAMKAKAAVENINISSYGIGDESVSFSNADPESSQQIVSWSNEVNEMLNESDIDFEKQVDQGMRNTGAFIG